MAIIHFLNVLEGDCNIIQHDSKRLTVIDVSNASNDEETESEFIVKSSAERRTMIERTQVPSGKKDYRQKHTPDNPITYIKEKLKPECIFRFIITHPDMDHLDGIKDLYNEFKVYNTWDTNNKKEVDETNFFGGYNLEDWLFYKKIRSGEYSETRRLTYYDTADSEFWNKDDIKILCPSETLVNSANASGDYHDSSYVILFTPPKSNGRKWKIILAGDSHDNSWEHILSQNKDSVSDIDVLFAPHHGRDSDRNYDFLEILKPKLTLFGNASSEHLAYDKYPETRITNNQAGFVILDISPESIKIFVKNKEFADDFRNNPKRAWGDASYNATHEAYYLGQLDA